MRMMSRRLCASAALAACGIFVVARLVSGVETARREGAGGLPQQLEPTALAAAAPEAEACSAAPCPATTTPGASAPAKPRVVFSLTTLPRRLPLVKPVLDALIEGQTRPLDAVYLALPPGVGELPGWLERYNETSRRPGVLKILRMAADYGPASKLLAALREGGERSPETIVIYGDDDILYGSRIVELHLAAQAAAAPGSAAFGTRKIGIGEGSRREEVLEATGSISVRASALPEAAFAVGGTPDACRLSDDYWLSHHFARAGVRLKTLPECLYDFNSGAWPRTCGAPFEAVPEIEGIGALSGVQLDPESGEATRGGGDWRDQLNRYEVCQRILEEKR